MPAFEYVAVDRLGKKRTGKIEARDRQDAVGSLKEQGIFVKKIKPFQQSIWTRELQLVSPRVKSEHFVIFCRQFAVLIRAGISVVEAVNVLRQQTESKPLQKTLQQVLTEIRSGTQLSVACQEHPRIFTPIFVNMIRAGEASGDLDDTLERLAVFFEKEHAAREKIKSALAYPVTVAIIACLVTAFLMWKVVPQFISTFENFGVQLPLVTRIVVAVSSHLQSFWYQYIGLPILLVAAAKAIGKTAKGRYQIDYLKLKVPVFGKLQQKLAMARFSRTFSSLYGAGVPMLQILSIVANVVNNEVIASGLKSAQDNLRTGQSLTEPLRGNWVFPPMVTHMVAVGEKTGSMDELLEKVADFYEGEVDAMADRLKSMLEPLLIMAVAVVVGIIVLSILLPPFTLYKNL